MPLYRARADCYADATPYRRGAEFHLRCWPGGKFVAGFGGAVDVLEPIDSDAVQILAYYRARSHDPGLPNSPFDERGQLYLPAQLNAIHGRHFPPAIPPQDEQPNHPFYLSTIDDVLEHSDRTEEKTRGAMFGRRIVSKGERIAFTGWPLPAYGLEPLNEPAIEIVKYFDERGGDSRLPPSPWNFADGGSLYLPKFEPRRSPVEFTKFAPPQTDRATERAFLKMDTRRPANPFAARR
jgi:hypothetical protein